MYATAYDYGQVIEITVHDETGGVEDIIELDLDGTRDETIEAAGFEIVGEWLTLPGGEISVPVLAL